MVEEIQRRLMDAACAEDGNFLQRYFKTGPGEYGEGDLFRGIRLPVLRALCGVYRRIPLEQATLLLTSRYHEDRLLALLIMVRQYATANEAGRGAIYQLYLRHTRFINNWDLVDASAAHIVGAYLLEQSHEPLEHLARSASLWERRIAIMATFHFIRRDNFATTFTIAEMLLADKADLIHKAVGWMLREVGKRDLSREEAFLVLHYRQMPRTMLRYAIERFPEERRQGYLKGSV